MPLSHFTKTCLIANCFSFVYATSNGRTISKPKKRERKVSCGTILARQSKGKAKYAVMVKSKAKQFMFCCTCFFAEYGHF